MAAIPEELLSLIISCVREPVKGTCPTHHRTILRQVGAASCLVSRHWLHHGRTILYGALDTRDSSEGGYSVRAEHFRDYPHLAAFLRECTLELRRDFSATDVNSLMQLLKCVSIRPEGYTGAGTLTHLALGLARGSTRSSSSSVWNRSGRSLMKPRSTIWPTYTTSGALLSRR